MVAPFSSQRPLSLPSADTDRDARKAANRRQAQIDKDLVCRFNAGDEDAFGEIVVRYRTRMFNIAFLKLRDRADAEEISQDTLIRAHRGLKNFRGDSSLASWLYRIALNLSHNRYWHSFRRRRHAMLPFDAALGDDTSATVGDMVASDDPSPAREAVNDEFATIVEHCTGLLPPLQREILTMRNVQHHSYAHISRQLKISVGTTKSRIARARSSLRVLVGKAYPEFNSGASSFESFESFRTSGLFETRGA